MSVTFVGPAVQSARFGKLDMCLIRSKSCWRQSPAQILDACRKRVKVGFRDRCSTLNFVARDTLELSRRCSGRRSTLAHGCTVAGRARATSVLSRTAAENCAAARATNTWTSKNCLGQGILDSAVTRDRLDHMLCLFALLRQTCRAPRPRPSNLIAQRSLEPSTQCAEVHCAQKRLVLFRGMARTGDAERQERLVL